ncbi:Di-copper centre-containing protein [Astrocystis sublimbata]|nr:Di-copper centre-containing protein [Astrocystis sublimbata]
MAFSLRLWASSPAKSSRSARLSSSDFGREALTLNEKQAYIEGELCLMKAPPLTKIPGAMNIWDELQYTHTAQSDYIHTVGQFLPFHRYFLAIHQRLLKSVCGYAGPIPYWNEPLDVGAVDKSLIFDPIVGFGGQGHNHSICIDDGPFLRTILRFHEDLTSSEYCISRNFDDKFFAFCSQPSVDLCLLSGNFVDAWKRIEFGPHAGGHGGVGGVMENLMLSPGDPVFWLHHTFIDKIWWDWQTRNISVGGNNTFGGRSDPAYVPHFGDGGNTTTLNHVLFSHGLAPNITIDDVMDLGGPYMCAEYV